MDIEHNEICCEIEIRTHEYKRITVRGYRLVLLGVFSTSCNQCFPTATPYSAERVLRCVTLRL